MKHNTIEVKLNSYGTLEVVTAPVKLYKDSYNVVKLRVNAPMVAESMLKVYLGDEDEAGEKVWTSNAYSWQIKETVVINGVPYNVYEEYLPQEFCSESGDIRITFAQVVGKDGVNQILTSGSLNLYVSGDGFNFNGVEIAESDKLAIKINEVLTYYKDYDLKIRSQAEFVAFYESLDNGTCTAHSVLFVGDGGSLVFTREDGKGLLLPETLHRLDGMNNAKILILNHSEKIGYQEYATGGIRYNTKPTTDNYSISNLIVECRASDGVSGMAIANARNIVNCMAYGYSTGVSGSGGLLGIGIGIYECDNIINSQCFGYGTDQETVAGAFAYGFMNCNNLVNCIGNADKSQNMYKIGFEDCTNLTNCKANAKSFAFRKCDGLVNCSSIITMESGKLFRDCTNINATREDIEDAKAYVDDKVGNLMVVLQDINSGEGV